MSTIYILRAKTGFDDWDTRNVRAYRSPEMAEAARVECETLVHDLLVRFEVNTSDDWLVHRENHDKLDKWLRENHPGCDPKMAIADGSCEYCVDEIEIIEEAVD